MPIQSITTRDPKSPTKIVAAANPCVYVRFGNVDWRMRIRTWSSPASPFVAEVEIGITVCVNEWPPAEEVVCDAVTDIVLVVLVVLVALVDEVVVVGLVEEVVVVTLAGAAADADRAVDDEVVVTARTPAITFPADRHLFKTMGCVATIEA